MWSWVSTGPCPGTRTRASYVRTRLSTSRRRAARPASHWPSGIIPRIAHPDAVPKVRPDAVIDGVADPHAGPKLENAVFNEFHLHRLLPPIRLRAGRLVSFMPGAPECMSPKRAI